MCKGIILNGESLYLLCCCYIIADINEKIEKLSRRYGEVMLPKYDEDKQLNYSEQFGLTIL